MTKKSFLILTFVAAALIPMLGIQQMQPNGIETTSAATLSVAERHSTSTCSANHSGLPQITWFNASSASAAIFDCVDCMSDFDRCYNNCKIEPDDPGEVLCQENCVITVAECLGSCGI